MGYSEKKDKLLKLFECGDTDNGGSLQIAIFSYDGGPAKLQMTRSFLKKDGSYGYGKAGRLTIEEFIFLQDNSEEIIKIMKGDDNKNK